MGSVGETTYSVPHEAQKILQTEILNNPLVPSLPSEIKDAGHLVHFSGNDLPSIPINWRFAESVSALKAFEASMLNVLRSRKYQVPMSEVSINTDHASLFVMSPFMTKVVTEDGKEAKVNVFDAGTMKDFGFPSTDLHNCAGLHRTLATNIYRTSDGRYYHCHGRPKKRYIRSVAERVQKVVEGIDSRELDHRMNEEYKQAGTIAWTTEEFAKSEHGKANAHVGLYDLSKIEGQMQPAAWWPDSESMPSSPSRPLAGLKVVDLTRVIAAPSITRGLAEMGLHQDLNWGKWNAHLDLKSDEGREILRGLIREADVVVEGYRPGAMERNGFSREAIFELVKDRGRGIVHVRENCYGWNGPWKHRSGWQQISDACCGVSMKFGQAMGNDEAVTPVFPNSDYCTGVIGCVAVLHALVRRAEEGGSYGIDVALNYYSQWLVKSVGEYPSTVWSDLRKRHGSPVFRHYHAMGYTLPAMFALLEKNASETLYRPEFFERRVSKVVGQEFVQVKPIARFADDVQLGYNVGTRSNGVDQPRWPENLRTEIVA
ncbi:hypothetical protein B0A55_08796 [Friedmanniomyces simplex]|uniref:Uncharacterized protein n=1 Tax=Friedmanniomyces simplex TaxID=329884 RepID=A0A4U0WZZ1_9PEZI|nr:hypothetical protein B0A55_08796 [Friedmanniomyces simplex]